MKTFNYTIKDEIGIHARPAGMLAKLAKDFESEIIIEKDGKGVNATKLMMLMGLGIKGYHNRRYARCRIHPCDRGRCAQPNGGAASRRKGHDGNRH